MMGKMRRWYLRITEPGHFKSRFIIALLTLFLDGRIPAPNYQYDSAIIIVLLVFMHLGNTALKLYLLLYVQRVIHDGIDKLNSK